MVIGCLVLLLLLSSVIVLATNYMYRRNKSTVKWFNYEADNPEGLGGDELAFVFHRGVWLPLRKIEVETVWKKRTSKERDEIWSDFMKSIKKGKVKKLNVGEGKFLIIPAGAKEKKILEDYEKFKREV